jgi:hypothetical protein
LRRGRDTISRAYGWAHEAAEGVHLGSLRMPRRSDIAHLTEANPLLLGAVGLGIGVALATLFPRRMSRRTRPNGSVRPVKAAARRRRKNRARGKAPAGASA